MSNRTPQKFVNSFKFVVSPSKAIYNILSLLIRLADKFLFGGSAEDNICISDAQYYELSAQQNLWCEILEF